MLSSGMTQKYLLYAVGEIALVVVGILIALQINNWNEDRRDQQKEQEILNSLAEDFRGNLEELDRSLTELTSLIELQRKKLSYSVDEPSLLTPEIVRDLRGTYFVTTEIVEGTLTSVLNSEKLELINNERLKKLLTSYPAFIEKVKTQEEWISDYVINKQRPIHRKYVSLAEMLPDDEGYQHIKQKAFKSDYVGLLKDREYFNVTVGIILTNEGMQADIERLRNRTQEILDLLLSETKTVS